MADSNSTPFSGNGVFTSDNPLAALPLAGTVQWVAIRPDLATPEEVKELQDRGFTIVIWEEQASERGVAAIQQYGAVGYIAQAEGPGQLEAANTYADKINVPKALVTNVFMGDGQWPPGWTAMPEAYQNSNPNATPENMVAAARRAGATDIVPVIGTMSEGGGRVPTSNYLEGVTRSGAGSYAAFAAESMSPADIAALQAYGANDGLFKNKPPIDSGDALSRALGNDYSSAASSKQKTAPPVSGDALDRTLDREATEPVIAPPAPYTGGAGGKEWLVENPEKTWVYEDQHGRKIRRTVTASGAVIDEVTGVNPETGKDYTPFRVRRGPKAPVEPSPPDRVDRSLNSQPSLPEGVVMGPDGLPTMDPAHMPEEAASTHGATGFDRAHELNPEIAGTSPSPPSEPVIGATTPTPQEPKPATESPLNHFGLYNQPGDDNIPLGNQFRQ